MGLFSGGAILDEAILHSVIQIRFFAAAEAGRWDELDALAKSLRDNREKHSDLGKLWPAILETWCIAEAVHDWPAQKLLDYGQAVLGSLRPDMIYVGGTDPGRGIPTFLNETSDGERHIVLTQNCLDEGSYLEYVNYLYGDRLATLTQKDSERAFQEYLDDAQKRFEHDRQFPNEPKQVHLRQRHTPGAHHGTPCPRCDQRAHRRTRRAVAGLLACDQPTVAGRSRGCWFAGHP